MNFRRYRHRTAPPRRPCARSARATDGSSRLPTCYASARAASSTALSCSGGLGRATNARVALGRHTLKGDDGPAGTGVVAFAALPFDRNASGTLSVPEFCVTQFATGERGSRRRANDWQWRRTLRRPSRRPLKSSSARARSPFNQRPRSTPTTWRSPSRFFAARRSTRWSSRALSSARCPTTFDAAAIAQRLRHREPICTLYSLPTDDGRRFVGASPELLVRRSGDAIQCHPLAGTITLPSNVAPDDYETWLLGSTKNLHEHSVVVDEIVSNLSNVYDDIDGRRRARRLWRYERSRTWVRGSRARWNSPRPRPTRSKYSECSTRPPPSEACHARAPTSCCDISKSTTAATSRGRSAGLTQTVTANGGSDFRGVLLRGREFEAWAGAGIVSESDPIAEREETRDKLAVVLSSVLVDPL